MGQYYLCINPDKKQYLDPHKFGGGLKLMEFSGQAECLPQALVVLLAHANGRGGGDLGDGLMTPEDEALVGSWAGDRVVVAGDYDDPGLFVPEGDVEKYWLTEEGQARATYYLGKDDVPSDPTLYSVARALYEDVSDRVLGAVARGDSPYHPWAAADLAEDGWRMSFPGAGLLPEKEPLEPAGGQDAWEAYRKHATPYADHLLIEVETHLGSHPGDREKFLRALTATDPLV